MKTQTKDKLISEDKLFEKFTKKARYYTMRGQYKPAYEINGLLADDTEVLWKQYLKQNKHKLIKE
jgi:hypothetical protein